MNQHLYKLNIFLGENRGEFDLEESQALLNQIETINKD